MTEPLDTAALLAAIVASSDDAIVSKDLNGYVTSWNRAAARLFGYTADEMVGQHITRIIPMERRGEEDYVLSTVRSGASVDHFETVRQRKDGSLIDISLSVSPVRTADGRVVGVSKVARDISERKRMERDAVRLAAIVESSDDAIISKDLNGIVQSWNRGAEQIFGYAADEVIGLPITILIPEERLPEEDDVLARIRAGRSVRNLETVRRAKDGRTIDVSLTVSPIRARSGEVIGASTIARDVTEQRRLRREAEEASRAKDEFLATLSHELRTPLNTVLGYTHMLQAGTIAPDALPRTLQTIGRNADALTRLVNDVLDTSRIVTGKIRLNLQDSDVSAVVGDAIEAITPAAQGKSIRVIRDVAEGLHVQGDPDRLRQVLWNLLSNAVKFTQEGGTVSVSAVQDARSIRIAVQDSGIGITPEALPFVFQRFWQADPRHTRQHGGLGLGLALARTFVELHGGLLEVHSAGLGHGARFDVVLPAVPGSVARFAARKPASR